MDKLIYILQILKDKDEQINNLTHDVTELKSKSAFNPDVTKLENENLDLKARIIQCEREINMAVTKVKEMDMLMEIRSKERQGEAEQRRNLNQRIAQIKTKIEEENKANEMVIAEKVKVKEEKEKNDIKKLIETKIKEKNILADRKITIESVIEQAIQEKVGIQQDTLDHDQTGQKLSKDTGDQKLVLSRLIAELEHLERSKAELEQRIKPVVDDNVKFQKTIEILIPQNERLKESIDHLLQQAQLAGELKNVNLEELKLLSKSNDTVHQTLLDLTKKWEHIQRFNSKIN